MQMFSCSVRPGGHITHEVPRDNVPAAEIVLLRSIHGLDAVVNIKKSVFVPEKKLSVKQVRARLVQLYGAKAVDNAFGKFTDVPAELPDVSYEQAEDEDVGEAA